MRVAIVGAAGMLGAVTVREWLAHGHHVTALTRADLDVTNPGDVQAVLERLAPDVIINCTAYNRVDDAEDDPSTSLAVNTWAVRSLARAAEAVGAVFVHYSTDFVFDGVTDRPYAETDAPNPQSAYGMSKLMGEWFALEVGRTEEVGRPALEGRQYVLRVESLFGGSASRSTIDRMLGHMRAGQTVLAFRDRVVSPSHVDDVARATRHLVTAQAPGGLYHCVNSGYASWLEVAESLRGLAGLPHAEIRGTNAGDVGLKAQRPKFAALSNQKLIEAGVPMPSWQAALSRHLGATGVQR